MLLFCLSMVFYLEASCLYVVNYGKSAKSTFSVIDLEKKSMVGFPTPIGCGSSAVAVISALGHPYAYVTSYVEDSVWVIDLKTNQPVCPPVAVGMGPTSIATAFVETVPYAYVVNSQSDNISVINLNTNTLEGEEIEVGPNPTAIAIANVLGKLYAYVTNYLDSTVSVINLKTREVEDILFLDSAPSALAIASISGVPYAYIISDDASSLSIINLITRKPEIQKLKLEQEPISIAALETANVAYAYLGHLESRDISVFNLHAKSFLSKRISADNPPYTIISGKINEKPLIFSANYLAATVSVIDPMQNKVLYAVSSGEYPVGLAVFSVEPASSLRGMKKKQPLQENGACYSRLFWKRSSSPNLAGYFLYRNRELIATLSNNVRSYLDRHVTSLEPDVYSLVAFDQQGRSSEPVTLQLK